MVAIVVILAILVISNAVKIDKLEERIRRIERR